MGQPQPHLPLHLLVYHNYVTSCFLHLLNQPTVPPDYHLKLLLLCWLNHKPQPWEMDACFDERGYILKLLRLENYFLRSKPKEYTDRWANRKLTHRVAHIGCNRSRIGVKTHSARPVSSGTTITFAPGAKPCLESRTLCAVAAVGSSGTWLAAEAS
jgi:hypothetical protein